MLRASFPIIAATLLALTSSGAEPPALPCKSPQELLHAVQYALQSQDTNLFWRLHSWTNVSTKREWAHKEVMSVHFKQAPSDELTFSSFRIIQPPPGYTNVVRLKNGEEKYFNIPVTGIILFRQKGRGTNPTLPTKSMVYSADGEVPFGPLQDGTFWIPVQVVKPGTNTLQRLKLPPGGITNLLGR